MMSLSPAAEERAVLSSPKLIVYVYTLIFYFSYCFIFRLFHCFENPLTDKTQDGNEIDKHVVPLAKHKKKVIKLSSVKTDSEPDVMKNKESLVQLKKAKAFEGSFCNFCGHKRDGCIGKNCHFTSHLLPKEDKEPEPTVPKNVFEETNTSDTNWTDVQDDIIKAMKSENRPWKEIASVVGSTKKKVQNRFKALQAMIQDHEKDKNKMKSSAAEGLGISEIEVPTFEFGKLVLDEDSGVDDRGVNRNGAPFCTLSGHDGYGGDMKKSKKEDTKKKKKKDWTDKEENGSDWCKISPPGLSPTGISPVGSFDMPPIPKQAPSYGRPFVQSDSPPPQIGHFSRAQMVNPHLRPDLIWSTEDCHLLEDLENNYTRNKWLHMQADFFNWSGRMVDASIIERKFKEDGFQ